MKKYIYALLVVFIKAQFLFSQAPVVSNVSYSQRTDGSLIVDIYYDLADTDAETKKIVVEASADNGANWTLACTSLTGDVGSGIALGAGKHVVWDFFADNPNVSGSNYKVRVTASEVGTMTGNDGKTYQTVKIGTQWWMAENLKETQFRDGNAITNVTGDAAWIALTTEGYCAYNNSETTANTYGYLYNWYAVDNHNVTSLAYLAPAGWHVPTDAEWKELEMALGMSQSEADDTGNRGTNEGSKLAGRADLWFDGSIDNNSSFGESGFSALPGGFRGGDWGGFGDLGYVADFWSSGDGAWFRGLYFGSSGVSRSSTTIKQGGYSVRLIRD